MEVVKIPGVEWWQYKDEMSKRICLIPKDRYKVLEQTNYYQVIDWAIVDKEYSV